MNRITNQTALIIASIYLFVNDILKDQANYRCFLDIYYDKKSLSNQEIKSQFFISNPNRKKRHFSSLVEKIKRALLKNEVSLKLLTIFNSESQLTIPWIYSFYLQVSELEKTTKMMRFYQEVYLLKK